MADNTVTYKSIVKEILLKSIVFFEKYCKTRIVLISQEIRRFSDPRPATAYGSENACKT